MAEDSDKVNVAVDIDLDEVIDDDFTFDSDDLRTYDEYENCELEVPGNFAVEDFDLEECVVSIPTINFVGDEAVHDFIQEEMDFQQEKKKFYSCKNCNKPFKNKANFLNHVKKCGIVEVPVEIARPISSSTKKKKVLRKDTISITDEELVQNAVVIFVNALQQVSMDPINNLKRKNETPGNKAKRLADLLLQKKEKEDFCEVGKRFVDKIAILMRSHNLGSAKHRELLWKDIHVNILHDPLKLDFGALLLQTEFEVNSNEFNMVYQSVASNIIKSLLQFEKTAESMEPDVKLSEKEQQVIYYVAGYVIFSLQKKYRKMAKTNHNPIAITALQFLDTLKLTSSNSISGNSFLEFTKKWVDTVNRGGLIRVSDEVFIFFRRLENVIRKVLNTQLLITYKGEDIRDVIEKRLTENSLVSNSWDSIARNISNESLFKTLKRDIITKWTDIRARAYVTSYVQIIKRRINELSKTEKDKSKVVLSEKTEVSLRKSLK